MTAPSHPPNLRSSKTRRADYREKPVADYREKQHLIDRLTHHADVTNLKGKSYRIRESELEAAASRETATRRKTKT